ncbi:MAG: DUF4190 domain-containing protein [Acutalibacteraceae bacterium]
MNSPQQPYNPGSGVGAASMVLGIVGLCTGWLYGIGCLLGIVGIVLSVVSGNKSKAVGLGWSGLATAGLVCSIIAVCTGAGCLLCTVCAIGMANSPTSTYGYY